MSARVLLNSSDMYRALVRVAHEILERNHGAEDIVLVGIRTRGLPLAERLQRAIGSFEGRVVPAGALDVLPYRDDLESGLPEHRFDLSCNHRARVKALAGGHGLAPVVGGEAAPVARQPLNDLSFPIADRTVVLIDDVLYTGRTVRAAMDALVDLGRPSSIQLAVLVDRGHRELPIRPDYVGKNIPSSRNELVRVRLVETDGEDSVTIVRREGGPD